jgi:hypothetical protein
LVLIGLGAVGAAGLARAQQPARAPAPIPYDEVTPGTPATPTPVEVPTGPKAPPAASAPLPLPSGVPAPPRITPGARPAITPAAMEALDRMGVFLRAQQNAEIESEQTTDDILASGQKVQYAGRVKLKIQRPDRMAAEIVSDRKNEQMFYDGTTFTVYQPKVGYYASFAAPPDLQGLVNVLEQRYGIDLPLADLFRWGTDTSQTAAIQRATYLGKSNVKGVTCAHYAYRQADVDWEIWIEEGAQPLPRKLVITTTSEKSQPQHTAIMTWNLAPKPDPLAFTFAPPPNAQRIAFDTAGAPPPTTRHGRAPSPRKGPTP